MSKENLEQFIQQISDSEELQTRIGDEIDTESLIALGAEHGCEFTAEDLHAELSDEELHGVAGGQSAGSQAATRAVVTRLVGGGDNHPLLIRTAIRLPGEPVYAKKT